MKIKIEEHINIPQNLAKVRNKPFWTFALNELHRLLTPYVPFEQGNLNDQKRIKAELLGGEIEYYSPYAHYQYEGKMMVDPYTGSSYAKKGVAKVYNGKFLKVNKENGHDKATDHWDKNAEPEQKQKLIQAMQGYVDSGRLNLK